MNSILSPEVCGNCYLMWGPQGRCCDMGMGRKSCMGGEGNRNMWEGLSGVGRVPNVI